VGPAALHSPVLADFAPEVRIGDTAVGPARPCYVIAEAGSNHDRDLTTALGLVDAAADAGCDAVKFQSFLGPDIGAGPAHPSAILPPPYSRWGRSLSEFYAAVALPEQMHRPLAERAAERGIHFLSSPFSERAVDLLVDLRVPALKIASFELVHLPLIRHAASTGLPLIISTGLAGLGDVERALDAAHQGGAREIVLLHCGSSYPLGPAGANLAAMSTLAAAFGVPVGYSDHTVGTAVPVAAAALGATALEKHFTLDPTGDGPDHSFALPAEVLPDLVSSIRDAQAAVGTPRKRRTPAEEEHAIRGRRSLFAAREVPPGAPLRLEDVKIVRPGVGLEPMLLDLLLDRPLVLRAEADTPLTWDHFLGSTKAPG
jgi:sialic acid synthase SpsE